MRKNAYIFNSGELKRKDNTVQLENEDGSKYLPVEDLSDIYIFGEVTVSKKFMELATQKEILLHFFNYHEYYVGTYYPREHNNSGYMTLKQAEYYLDEAKRRFLAYRFVEGSVKNILQVLKYYAARGKDNIHETIESIERLLGTADPGMEIEKLMAVEGNIRETYYGAFDSILDDPEFGFEKRTKRPPKNYLNTLISFGNSLLYTAVLSEIYNTHLDPRIGYLHSTNNRRFTLNLDAAEIFKPILVDRVIFTLVGKKMLTAKHFDSKFSGIFLKEDGMKIFVQEFEERMKTTINHKKLERPVSYRRLIRMELYKLEKHFMGEEEYAPFVSGW
ncbi:MAG: type I-B CRISPR-associated endonuclease Cas1b [Clostridiales bacterium]|jgi:CRISPR-associated protein Cas1|nr:type I-B CRISPR-associated endonuclease Cas1b [Eubacteriales bacterium]MDH7567307.1 type I-B CRISPR-associated endonuclease Cas1b [Clostridiales bacterium]